MITKKYQKAENQETIMGVTKKRRLQTYGNISKKKALLEQVVSYARLKRKKKFLILLKVMFLPT
jgi:hypothetical protein